jgi:hypothetical protein
MNYTNNNYEETFNLRHPHISVLTDNDGEVFRVGKENVREIRQHYAAGSGDCWFYDIEYEDGTYYRCFNPAGVLFGHPLSLEGE